LLLGWVGAMPAEEPYVRVGGFLTVAHFWLLFFYQLWFPTTLFVFLNSVRLVIKEEIAKYFEKKNDKNKTSNNTTTTDNNISNKSAESLVILTFDSYDESTKVIYEARSMFLWWIFLLFTVPGIECFLIDESSKSVLLGISKYVLI
jgi:hypothetical protein